MCVIMLADQTRPTDEMIEQAWKKNEHGGGVAARVKRADGTPLVWWKKGLGKEEMLHYNKTLELPYALHFRYSTSGGILEELCHPFEISPNTPYDTEGFTEGNVLFHNGTWNTNWNDQVLAVALKVYDKGFQLPAGKWSDTRAMAYMASFYGPNFLDFIEQRGLVFGPTDFELFWGKDGWVDVEGITCSNDKFWTKKYTNVGICRDQWCKEQKDLVNGYCPKHRGVNSVDPSKGSSASKGTETTLICTRCAALLGVGNPHNAGCPDEHLGTASLNTRNVCKECMAVSDIGLGHTATCSKRTAPNLVKKNRLCQECKEDVSESTDHLITCTKYLKGGLSKDKLTVPGGGRTTTPFMILLIAEQMRRNGKMSNNQLKRIKERLDLRYINTKEMDLSNLMQYPVDKPNQITH